MREAAEIIKQAIPTRVLAESLGVHVDRQGEALCPFHADTNRSLHIYKDPRRGWACFGCKKGGTVIDFAMQWYGIDFRQAVVRLDADFGLCLPIGRKPTAQEQRRARLEREKRRQAEEQRRAALEAAEFAFWTQHARYVGLLNLIDDTRPKRAENEVSWLYATALKLLPMVRDEFERAQDALDQLRKEDGHGTPTAGTAA